MALNQNIINIERFVQFVKESGEVSQRAGEFLDALVLQVNQGIPLSGTGSPESVLSAEPFKSYYDTSAGDHYVKMSGSGDTGWVLV